MFKRSNYQTLIKKMVKLVKYSKELTFKKFSHLVIQICTVRFPVSNHHWFLLLLLLILGKTNEVCNLRETRALAEGEKRVWENIP